MPDRLLAEGWRALGFDERRRALCAFAEKLTRTPAAMTGADLDLLRAQGLAEADLLDLVQTVSYFNYINRVADALGVPAEPDWPA